jgi:hypothetical protein
METPVITPLRKKRLLILAKFGGGDHKRWYPLYLRLSREGLIRWMLGTAFITILGELELERLKNEN